ncbi:ribonuclease N [Streptomyces sp. NA04227]|uniref:ribonuclease domain-containing protein n=1 Tax=Streptomyces sp. NA04227 TaxID=2742136 RepID=UPI001591CCC8|nr:ribonuclease domain-containing protein [Streptomyces sp. NA04227]QKW05464.1 ribonuclease N [Streptomyces sp. NA04227]
MVKAVLRLLCLLLVCLVPVLGGCSSGGGDPARGTGEATPAWARGTPVVPEDRLPPEARRTLRLIDRGGPFPYPKDGSVFRNFERELPERPRGHYREYTVPTPGENDRGARRIVAGADGELFYTDDHYQSFEAVLR